MRMTARTLWTLLIALAGLNSVQAQEQTGRYYPLDHRKPLGEVARWNASIRPAVANYVQPVQVQLPTEGDVTFYQGSVKGSVALPAPAQVGMQVGHAYRIKISNLPNHPGVELYPTIELLGRLHPPVELKEKYPVPVEITAEEIETAINDQMVTKVIYLEQPQLAKPTRQVNGKMHVESLGTQVNLLEAADMRGRPIAILRMGGRVPDVGAPEDQFYSTSPIVLPGK